MSTPKLLLLPGDGIGPEVIAQVEALIDAMRVGGWNCEVERADIGGVAYDRAGDPLPPATLAAARAADAVILGAVGAPRYAELPREARPERGLLRLRAELGVFANLRPAFVWPALREASSLKSERLDGFDLLIVRELIGGIYFGEPRGLAQDGGERAAFNTMRYAESEIRRVAETAMRAARARGRRLCSVDKANVLEVSELWRAVVKEVARDYPDVELTHMYVDNAAMQLAREPARFDVLVTGNLFGDILSDLAAALAGSIGMLPSASLGADGAGLYEPVHGSAPDIAGSGRANPLAAILSFAMALRYSLHASELAERVERAVASTLAEARTDDLATAAPVVSTAQMGAAVIRRFTEDD